MINRRELLALIGGATALAPFGATAQPGLPVIGYLSSRSEEAEAPNRTPFLEGLKQAGFIVGQNVAIEYRYARESSTSAGARGRADRASGGVAGRARGDRRRRRRRRPPQPSRSCSAPAS